MGGPAPDGSVASTTRPSVYLRAHPGRGHWGTFVRLRRLEGRGPVPPIVASVGVGLIIQNGIRSIAGTAEWLYPVPASQDIVIVPGLGIHPVRGILTLVIGVTFVLSAHILLKYTNLGKAMRATADNLELAKATGIDTKRVTYAAWVVSCSFASTAGVLLGLGTAITPTMGFDVILLIFGPWGIAGRRPAFARRSYFIERITRALGGERGAIDASVGEANGGR